MARSQKEPKVAEVTVSPFVCKPPENHIVKILETGVVYAIIAQIIHSLGAMLSMDFYTNPAYFTVWSPLMIPPMANFFYYSIGFGFVTGVLLAMAYSVVHCCLPGRTAMRRGVVYGTLVFLVAGIPGALSMYLLINLPVMLILAWAVENLIIYLIGGALLGFINK